MTVTFIGHRDAPDNISPILKDVIVRLIEKEGADVFYIGTHGSFDYLAHSVMKKLISSYPQIKVYSVLAYMPKSKHNTRLDTFETLFPEEAAVSIPRFAISKRNLWMIDKCDVVITYVKRGYGGAAKIRKAAMSKSKRIIDL